MAIRAKELDGKTYYEVSVNIRSKLVPELRVQKMRNRIKTMREAQTIERELLIECSAELARREGSGITWGEAIEKWELAHKKGILGSRKLQATTIWDNVAALRKFTEKLLDKTCQEISPADIRNALLAMQNDGYSKGRLKTVKSAVSVVFKWGIEEGIIRGVHHSPSVGIELGRMVNEKPPQILSLVEIQKLLDVARGMDHEWYPVWAMALCTGMRSGELMALEWNDVDMENRLLTVSKSYNGRMKLVKSTKAGYWRKVPINSECEALLVKLRATATDLHVLPRINQWRRGEAARILREFCEGIGITSVNFHALRACFATHLLNAGITSPVVKKICGWTDEKVMTRYIRLAGVDVSGATEKLNFIRPESEVKQLVNLSDFRVTRSKTLRDE